MRGITSCLCVAVWGLLQIPVSSYAANPPPDYFITEYVIPTAGAQPYGIAVDAAGDVWFAELGGGKLGRLDRVTETFTEIPVTNNHPREVVCDPSDGKVLFTADGYNSGHYGVWFPEDRTLREYASGLPAASTVDCSLDPSGAFWFSGWDSRAVCRVTKTGLETFVPPTFGYMSGVADDGQGNLWLTIVGPYEDNPRLLKLNVAAAQPGTSSGFTEIPFPAGASGVASIRVPLAALGKIWFAIGDRSQLGCYDPVSGSFTNYPTPTPNADVASLTVDRWGRIWFAEPASNQIGMLDLRTATIREFPIPTPNSGAARIAIDLARDIIWFTEHSSNKLGRLILKLDTGDYDPTPIHYVSPFGTHTAPFTRWSTAATNIQAAIDVAEAGDTVLVTNGVYNTGGRVAGGQALTNRAAIDKPITVQSMNGPTVTFIVGGPNPGGIFGDGAIRCAYLTNGAVLAGFTLTNGHTRHISNGTVMEQSGGGAYGDTSAGGSAILSNCVLTANSAEWFGAGAYKCALNNCKIMGGGWSRRGGGVSDCTLQYCLLTGNGSDYGGGAWYCTLSNCTLTGNGAVTEGGGAVGGSLYNCLITSNGCNDGGGVWGAKLFNCVLMGNSAINGGGAEYCELHNCTLIGNSAVNSGGGSFADNLLNCILYNNTASNGANYAYSVLNYCCTTPDSGGTGNITSDPQFVNASAGNYHLRFDSPCIDAGTTNGAPADDLDGNPRPADGNHDGIAKVDMGAYERPYPSLIHYVSLSGLHLAPFTNWINAATNIQAAIDVAEAGDTVLVTNGVYKTGWTVMPGGSLKCRVVIANHITVRSVKGPEHTMILGASHGVGTNYFGDLAIRGVFMTNDASLIGFTVSNGCTADTLDSWQDSVGGGILMEDQCVVSNCVVQGNHAKMGGGGIFCQNFCRVMSSVVAQNTSADWAGGIRPGHGDWLDHCRIVENVAASVGGGVMCENGWLTDCVVERNVARWGGGGLDGGNAYLVGCYVRDNAAIEGEGGGLRFHTGCFARNSVLSGNRAVRGGGVGCWAAPNAIQNCTVVGNYADEGGGLGHVWGGIDVYNSIIWDNTATNGANYMVYGSRTGTIQLAYCCTTPNPGGMGNTTNEPMFVDRVASNLHLLSTSPCINAGTNQDWMIGATDLDGLARIRGGRVDMGAYEYEYIPSAWLAQYGLPSDGSADLTDNDGDRMDNWEEWQSNTDPTNATSCLRFTTSAPEGEGFVLRWQSAEGMRYRLKRSTNLCADGFSYLVRTNIVATPSINTETDTTAVGFGPWFYRVGVE